MRGNKIAPLQNVFWRGAILLPLSHLSSNSWLPCFSIFCLLCKNFYSFILKSEIRGYKRTFASQFWIFWACFVYFFLISPGNTFEKRQQKQRLAFFSKLCWDENHNIKPDLIAKSQNIPLFIKKIRQKRSSSLSQITI